jgi:predicted SprT family Zn-dependent metalloprotease
MTQTILSPAIDPQTPQERLHACRTLLDGHGLADWRLALSSAARRLGSCAYHTRTIRLSRHLLLLNHWPEVRDTLLHEAAHALVGQSHGHDRVWRAKAVELGATPRASAPMARVRMPEPGWEAWCPHCARSVGRYYRRPQRWRRGYIHPHCRTRVVFRIAQPAPAVAAEVMAGSGST